MKKSTHSKIKNTAILFELLTRQIASDTVKGIDQSPAIKIVKEFFGPSTNLAKELALYQALIKENYKSSEKAVYLIEAVVSARKKLNIKKLKEEKYNIVREISKHYNLKDMFKTSLNDYKLYASIYRVFEGLNIANPNELVDSRYTIIEHITNKKKLKNNTDNTIIKEYRNQSEDVRLLAYRLLVDKFNDKYKSLSVKQKEILKEYINNVSNTTTLKSFVIKEAQQLKNELSKQSTKVKDKVVKIKLNEVVNMLDKFNKLKTVNESNVLSLLLYYELQKELKNANK